MASLVPYPKAVPAYELGGDQYSGESMLELIDTFRTDKNTFISNNDKLHKWAMWRSRVNGSFIRNLPVTQDIPIDETTIREKRINIDRFMVHSDTDELKRLQMKDVYGHANGYPSLLGHSTYFLYGIPRVETGKDVIEGKQDNRRRGPRIFVEDESIRSRTPTPPPPRKQHFFVGSSQGTNSVISDDHGMTLELSHAHKSTSVFPKNPQDPYPEVYTTRLESPKSEVPIPYRSMYTKQRESPKSEVSIPYSEVYTRQQKSPIPYSKVYTRQQKSPKIEVPIHYEERPQFDSRQYESRHLVPQIVIPQYIAPQINVLQYQAPRYEIWREMNLIRDTQFELEYQEGLVDFDDDLSSLSGHTTTST